MVLFKLLTKKNPNFGYEVWILGLKIYVVCDYFVDTDCKSLLTEFYKLPKVCNICSNVEVWSNVAIKSGVGVCVLTSNL